MIRINLYKKSNIDMNLLIGTLEKERFNMPFYNRDIILRKGVDNTIEFSIRNHDRKAQPLKDGQFLKFVAINNELQQKICKKMAIVNANTGRYAVTITKDELNDYDEGNFIGHVSIVSPMCDHDKEDIVECNCPEELLYTGVDWYPYFNVEITPNEIQLLEESVIMNKDDFVKDTYEDDRVGKTYERFISTNIKSDKTPSQTFTLDIKDFVGTINIQGSNMDNPEHNEDDWFTIDTFDIDEETTDTITSSSELNCLWVRVEYIRELDSPATIEEVVYRN